MSCCCFLLFQSLLFQTGTGRQEVRVSLEVHTHRCLDVCLYEVTSDTTAFLHTLKDRCEELTNLVSTRNIHTSMNMSENNSLQYTHTHRSEDELYVFRPGQASETALFRLLKQLMNIRCDFWISSLIDSHICSLDCQQVQLPVP